MKWLETQRGRDLAGIGAIALVLLVVLWPVTFGGKLLLPADMLMVMQPWKEHSRELGFERVHTPFLDSIQQHYPWRKFAAEQMKQGIVPLWNPYMNCGMPFVANNQSACFYPETWLFMLMPPEHAFGWAALLSLTMGGAFMFLFLRTLGLRRSAAVVGAVPFVLCGFLVGWMLLPTVRAVPMWLPLMLLAFERGLRAVRDGRGAIGWASLCALAVGLQFLAGHLHVSLFILLVFAAYVAFRAIQTAMGGERRAGLVSVLQALASVFTGLLLAMLQLLPVLELAGMNPRKAGVDFAYVKSNAMVPAYLLRALMPDLFGSPVDYNSWGWMLSASHREYVETVWYVGVAPLLLLVAAVAWRKVLAPERNGRGQVAFWTGVWLGGAGLAWGTVLYWLLFHLVPPLKQLPGISRAVLICNVSAAVLAGMGFEALCRKLETRAFAEVRRVVDRAALVIGLLALAGGVGVWLYTGRLEEGLPGIGGYAMWQMLRCLGLVLASVAAVAVMTWAVTPPPQSASGRQGGKKASAKAAPCDPGEGCVPGWRIRWGKALLALIVAADLAYFAGHFLPATPARYLHARSEALDRMREDETVYRMTSLIGEGTGIDRMPPNLTMAFGLQDLQGSDSLVYDGYANLMGIVPRDAKGNPDPTSPLLDLLNCKYLLTSLDLTRTPGWKLLTTYETNVYENTQVLPRAFVAGRVEHVATEQALEKMKTGFDPAQVTYLSGAGSVRLAQASKRASLSIADYGTNNVTLEGLVPPGRVAVLSDMAYPGWHAYVEGRETPVLKADYTLRAVAPQQEAKQVRFVYYPASFAAGAFLTCLAVMFITCGLVMGWQRR